MPCGRRPSGTWPRPIEFLNPISQRVRKEAADAAAPAHHTVPTITLSSGRQFIAQEGETVLDAALRQGIALEHSCKTGRCGSCKSHVLAGSTKPVHAQTGLSAEELASGWMLTCASSATSDLSIDSEDLPAGWLAPARTLPCRVHALEFLAPDVLKVSLRLPPNSGFSHRPGQYIDVIGPGGLRRSYSIANAATASQPIELHIRRVEGGAMSQYWFQQAKPNDLLRLNGPLGTFFLRDLSGLDLLLLATGTGIAPIKAMLEELAGPQPRSLPRSITLYWGGRKNSDLYWDPASVQGLPHRFVPVLSREDSAWAGARGHIQHAVARDWPSLESAAVYACGSAAMIQDARTQLLAAGLPPRRFHSDAFVCSAAV